MGALLDLARVAAARPANATGAHYRWRIVMPDGRALESCFLPEVTATEVRQAFPGCTAEPLPDGASD